VRAVLLLVDVRPDPRRDGRLPVLVDPLPR
jgi:hypothetical protein